jgi:chromodomain-helicase-DNA-binding protein 4
VVDEGQPGQRPKDDDTQLYNELQKYKMQQKVLLTGTPLQNNPSELFNYYGHQPPGSMFKSVIRDPLEEGFGTLTNETVPKLHSLIRFVMSVPAVERLVLIN